VGAFIGSGGGLSLYQSEPAYQAAVQSTGTRTTPDVSLVADPVTGAWIADPFNLDPSNPFELVGGTSLSAPSWAALLALVDQGRLAAGQPTLGGGGPTETLQALYLLPQHDYNAITSGSNGYQANAGYNLVTGLGTPIANRLISDLIAYHGPGTTYSGATVAPLQDSSLTSTGGTGGGPINAINVFDSFTVTSAGVDYASTPMFRTVLNAVPDDALLTGSYQPAVNGPIIVTPPLTGLSHGAPIAFSIPAPTTVGPQSGPSSISPMTSAPAYSSASQALAKWGAVSSCVTPQRLQTIRLSGPTNSVVWNAPDLSRRSIGLNFRGDAPSEGHLARVEPAPLAAFSLSTCWDHALMAYLADGEATRGSVTLELNRAMNDGIEDRATSALDSLLMSGIAVALWGAREVRSRIGKPRSFRSNIKLLGLTKP
jgi:hypothetical protein